MAPATATLQQSQHPPVRQILLGVGLCRTCLRADDCTFPRTPGRPIRSCEEFEGADGPRGAQDLAAASAPGLLAVTLPVAESPDMKGLCVQCARRGHCAYPKPVGGVWHCEELI